MIDTRIAKRIKQIREHENLTQKDFGSQIGLTRDVIGNIEYERVEVKEYIIQLIVSKFNVNEDWLRTGEGKMTKDYYEEGELEYLVSALDAKEDEFKMNFIKFMLKQPDERWDMFEQMFEEYNEFYKKK